MQTKCNKVRVSFGKLSWKYILQTMHHILSADCWDWGIYHSYHVKPASSFIWLIHSHLYLWHYFFINKKVFCLRQAKKTILWQCCIFTDMCHFLFNLSHSVRCHLHKKCMDGKAAASYGCCIGRMLSVDTLCGLCLSSALHICLLTCEWTNGRDLLKQIYPSHCECLHKLACMVHVCHTCIANK